VLRFLPTQASQDHFPTLPPSLVSLFFQPLDGERALTFAGIMPCMFGYLKLSMINGHTSGQIYPKSNTLRQHKHILGYEKEA